LFISGIDNNQTYLEKLSKCNPAKWVGEEVAGSNFTSLAKDLFIKLCNPMPIERYTAEQALRHPWITRNFDSPIPQTESQKVRDVQAESLLRGAVNITFFLSVAKLRRNFHSVD
jgi:serine/threonine protein kinase